LVPVLPEYGRKEEETLMVVQETLVVLFHALHQVLPAGLN